jgi:phenylalanyl-tRNA synthetase alpha chain
MESPYAEILAQARELLAQARTEHDVEQVRVRFLGRKGLVAEIFRGMPGVPPEERPAAGRAANALKDQLGQLIADARGRLTRGTAAEAAADPTLPAIRPPRGHLHPISQMIEEIADIFRALGFDVVGGPEVEMSWYNFDALNVPPDHPARDDWDTFYINDDVLLRPQTSPAQIRVMQSTSPPLRIIAPGRCFRRDTEDATHFSMFHQVEGLMIDQGVSFSDLKAVLHIFLRQLFRQDVDIRFQPDFFPFTEPSAQLHCTCVICHGEGCRTCAQSGWLELLGCGMVDPNVFEAVGYDPEQHTGWAFGVGVERLAMLRHRIPDGRMLFQGDVRFLTQF